MKKTIRTFLFLIVIVLLIVSAVFLVRHKKHQLAQAPVYGIKPVPVRAETARKGNMLTKIDYLAVVEPIRVANISARLTSTVEKVFYDEGDKVTTSDELITLDARAIKDDITSLQATISQTRSHLIANDAIIKSLQHSFAYWTREAKRDKTLAEKGDIPGAAAEATADKASEFHGKLESAINQSKAFKHLINSLTSKKAQLETTLTYCHIKSPYDGVVTLRLVDPGDLAAPGKKLMVVEDHSQLKLAFDVPQQDLANIHTSLPVTFKFNGKEYHSTIAHIYPSLDKARMLRAEIYLKRNEVPELTTGQYVSISVITKTIKNVVMIPSSALIPGPNAKPYAFVVKNKKLAPMPIQVIASDNNVLAVKGIEPGSMVVVNTFLGWAKLAGGMKVEIIPNRYGTSGK